MTSTNEKYCRLVPFTAESRALLAINAVSFFSPCKYKEKCEILGKSYDNVIRPLAGSDFLDFLEKTNILSEAPRYTDQIRLLLEQMATTGILNEMGRGGGSVDLPKSYFFMKQLTKIQQSGWLWLSPALGADFIYYLATPGIVHISGVNSSNDSHAGTGIIFDPHHILTCRHVVKDMKVNAKQIFQGLECTITGQFPHPVSDVAVIQVNTALQPVAGLAFNMPKIAQSVYTLGYPKIPFTREAALIIHRGEVTNESVITLDGHNVFLYSAIARPGNSGGPIISSDGYVLGISMQELTYQDETFSPHYAGVSTQEIYKAVDELGIGVQIPIEKYE
jgi:Trypsin-like peptidase domain